MRILLVDENADFCAVLREYLREGLQDASAPQSTSPPESLAVKEWHPVSQGVPAAGKGSFKWNFDALLVNCQADGAATLAWIGQARESAGPAHWPPVLLLVGGREADVVTVAALKLGVVDCLPRLQLTPAGLYEALTSAVEERRQQISTENRLVHDDPPPPPLFEPDPVMLDPPMPPILLGHQAPAIPQIRGYRIDRLIGEGGTARVYLAWRDDSDRQVVLKVLLPELSSNPEVVSRFMQEFSLIQKIKSVYVTRIFDLHYDSGNAYLAMEYFGAGDLRDRVPAGGMPPVQALKIFAQIARALGAIHDAGVIHRDLKPHNIMFRNQHHLAIVDFGGAKAMGDSAGITKVGHVIGTPKYMSPEQITGTQVDQRSDLYSLGVILHLLLTGQTLYVAPTPMEMMQMHLQAPIPRLPDELDGFQKLLNKLVAKDPAARFQSARELYAYIAY